MGVQVTWPYMIVLDPKLDDIIILIRGGGAHEYNWCVQKEYN